MNHHFRSLFISAGIHLLILLSLFYSFKLISSNIGKTDEKKVCIKLGQVVEVAQASRKKEIKQEPVVQHKVQKKSPKKVQPPTKKPLLKEKKVIEQKVDKAKPLQEQKIVQKSVSKSSPTKVVSPSKISKQKESSQTKYIHTYIDEIVRLLQENLYYPRRARKKGIEGEITVRFLLDCDAKVSDIEVLSSNSELLSRAAIKTIENLSEEFPKPKEDLILTIPISYHLH